MRWIVAAVAVAVLLLGAGGAVLAHLRSGSDSVASVRKASTCPDAYRLLGLHPSQVTSANSACFNQDLKFSGELSGTVAQAYAVGADAPSPTSACAVPKRWNGYPQALLAMAIGGKTYRLRISPPGSSEHKALTVNNLANVVELASIKDPSTDWNQASGTVNLNPDGVTGSIDASLLRDVAGAQPVRVSGKWACGAPLPPATFDANLPCANFYALNQLQEADVARMKAGACNPQSLTLSGDVSGRLDHAVTDIGVFATAGFGGDNTCEGINQDYTATFKFTIGDESFLLDLDAKRYPAIGPGQYSAQSTGISIGAVLFLGHADASNHGAFVADNQVFWLGSGGSFTIAPDMKSGTVDADLQGALMSHSASRVHIAGNWRCAA